MGIFAGSIDLRSSRAEDCRVSGGEQASAGGVQLFIAADLQQRDCGAEELLKAYLKLGTGAFNKLSGAFCFALWEAEKQRLLLGSDHCGQKKLYYRQDKEGRVHFSESLAALKNGPGFVPEIDFQSLADYFALGYIAAPRTIYTQLRLLQPASTVSFKAGEEPRKQIYWRAQFLPKLKISFAEAAEECRRLLTQSIQNCLAGQERATFLLSGGIDSSLILALGKDQLAEPALALSIAFSDPLYDESALAAQTAAWLQVRHQLRCFEPEDLRLLPGLLQAGGQPFADSSLLPSRLALLQAEQQADLVLSGEGGDELFCGYRRLQFLLWRFCCAGLPAQALGFLSRLLLGWLPEAGEQRGRWASFRRAASALSRPALPAYAGFQELFSAEMRQELLLGREHEDYLLTWQEILEANCGSEALERFDALELGVYLPQDCLQKLALAKQGLSLQVRCPMLERELLEFALRLPRQYKISFFERKRPLRAIAKKLLPPELLRQNKRGFGLPMRSWLRTELADEVRELHENLPAWDKQGYLNQEYLRRLCQEHLQGQKDHGARLWSIHCLKTWLQE